jgi:hypothetical protein
MDLSGLAEIAKAAGQLLPALSLPWRGEPSTDPTQQQIYNLSNEKYEKLRFAVNDENMRLLLHLESCSNCNPRNLFHEVHRDYYPSLSDRDKEFVLKEFQWRLEYLSTIGMISSVTGGQYAISHLGKNFVRRAREARDYYEVMRR